MAEHPNVANIKAALSAFGSGDRDEMQKHLADDIVWHVGGNHHLSGDYRGGGAVLDYHERVRELTGGSLKLEPVSVMADAEHAGIFLRVSGERSGSKLDTVMAEALRLDGQGRWVEYWAQADDQVAVDEFWSA